MIPESLYIPIKSSLQSEQQKVAMAFMPLRNKPVQLQKSVHGKGVPS